MIKMQKDGELNKNQLDCFVESREAEELYDVVNDPFQLTNLAGNADAKEALNKMRGLLDNWITEFDDRIPENPTPDKFHRWDGRKFEE